MAKFATTKGSFKVHGLAELVRNLEAMPEVIRDKAVGKGTKEGAKIIQQAAISLAPEGSHFNRSESAPEPGRLKQNIVVRERKDTIFDSEHQVVIRAHGKADNPRNSFYAYFLEYGTSKMAAKPFMRPAFEQNKESAVATMAGYIKEAVGSFRTKLKGIR